MNRYRTLMVLALALLVATAFSVGVMAAADKDTMHTSTQFVGPKANTGNVTHSKKGGQNILTLSNDFVVPDTPDPHWQVVDSKGMVYRLDKLKIKGTIGDTVKKEIVVPAYVRDIAKVQIYCAWAETNLGEASFSSPVK